ncbi:unnamed protein product [Clonostachys rosea]|uniref:Uncharacterized protein n=1 Tax=Bionectria ochroleuca TaxID=29856 RepID=A0ABY6U434_BIOOC|nr:unnamed protein product [Clonostachys rosea]
MLSPKHFATRGTKFTSNPEELQKEMDVLVVDAVRPLHDLKMICSLRYPINKSRTKENTAILQAAERHLDGRWDKYDAHLEKQLCPETVEKLQTGVPKRGELRRTPDWIEPEIKPAQQTTEDQEPANVKFDGWTDEPFNKSKLEIRVKPKTTGQARSGYDEESPQPALDDAQDLDSHLPRFTLRNRAYRTFSSVFNVPSPDTPPSEVIWTDFLHAMRAVGFTSEKLYGSVWRFTPNAGKIFGGVESAINFHEPHPSGRLPFWTARRYGRRMTRNYGITGQSFSLAEKE